MAKKKTKQSPQTAITQSAHPLPPIGSDASELDQRTNFKALSTVPPPNKDVQRAFLAAKLKLLRTQPRVHPADREAAMKIFAAETGAGVSTDEIGPVPGGVGYGFFYNTGFKTSFATGTAISWEIVCPNLPGGNVSNWLYLTATNRSALGVEAFVAYQGQQAFTFNIYDWSLPQDQRWQPAVPNANLGPYLGIDTANGTQSQVLSVINRTYQQAQGSWANEVRLLSVQDQVWHLVYQRIYPATLQDQTAGFVGSWAPIVETFQDVYSGTQPMGAFKTQTLGRDGGGNWGQWSPLDPTQSDLRTDNKGFSLMFVDPNYSWVVSS
jgi:hypothetical protein